MTSHTALFSQPFGTSCGTLERFAGLDLNAILATPDHPLTDDTPYSRETRPAESIERRGVKNGMLNADQVASRWRIAGRHVIVKLLSKLPGARFKTWLVKKLLGVKCGEDVGFAYGSLLDPYDPSMISFGDNVIVGFEAKIFVHMFTLTRQRIKPVKVGNNVIIGACSIIAPGVTIGDGASIAPGTIVTRNVPAGALAMGNPMQIKKRGECSELIRGSSRQDESILPI